MMDDPFILASDPEGLRRHGIPMHPDTAIRAAERGEWPRPIRLTPHKAGWSLSTIRGHIAAKAGQ